MADLEFVTVICDMMDKIGKAVKLFFISGVMASCLLFVGLNSVGLILKTLMGQLGGLLYSVGFR